MNFNLQAYLSIVTMFRDVMKAQESPTLIRRKASYKRLTISRVTIIELSSQFGLGD